MSDRCRWLSASRCSMRRRPRKLSGLGSRRNLLRECDYEPQRWDDLEAVVNAGQGYTVLTPWYCSGNISVGQISRHSPQSWQVAWVQPGNWVYYAYTFRTAVSHGPKSWFRTLYAIFIKLGRLLFTHPVPSSLGSCSTLNSVLV